MTRLMLRHLHPAMLQKQLPAACKRRCQFPISICSILILYSSIVSKNIHWACGVWRFTADVGLECCKASGEELLALGLPADEEDDERATDDAYLATCLNQPVEIKL